MKKIIIAFFLLSNGIVDAQVLSTTPLTSGNLLVTRFDVSNTTAQKYTVVEINKTTKSVVQSFDLPYTSSGGAIPITTLGTTSTDCQLTLSEDGKYVTMVGYKQDAGGTTANSTSTIAKVVGRLSSNTFYKAFELPDSSSSQVLTGSSDPYNGAIIRSAYSLDGTQFYLAGGSTSSSTAVQGGIWYFTDWNQNNPVQINALPNTRAVRVNNNVMYYGAQDVSTGTPSVTLITQGFYKFNAPTPITTPLTLATDTTRVLTPRSAALVSFYFTPDGNTLYIFNQGTGTTTKGIEKWQFAAGTWTWKYSLFSATSSPRAFAPDFSNIASNGTVDFYVLFATKIEKWTDNILNTTSPSPVTATTIYTETGTNLNLRGISFAPTNSTIINLPLQLGNLNAMKTNAGNVLGWSVIDESNEVNEYEIEKSSNGYQFQSAAIIKAKHTGNSLTQYNFTDNTITASKMYYRVMLKYIDGRKTYSNIATIANKEDDNITIINPAKNYISIGFKDYFSGTVELLNSAGNKILSTKVNQATGWYNMPIPSIITKGMYVVKLTNNNQTNISKQVIINQ